MGFFANKLNENKDYKALIAVPKGRVQQWQNELEKYTDLPSVIIPEGASKDKVDDILLNVKPGTLVISGHRELSRSHEMLNQIQTNYELKSFDGAIVDEPHELQARGQSGNIGAMGKKMMNLPFKHRIGLTATPARRKPSEAYDIIKWSSGTKDLGSKAGFNRMYRGMGSGTNAQDTSISSVFFNTIQPFISGDRITTPDFKVFKKDITLNRSSEQIENQKRIELEASSHISTRKDQIVQDVRNNANHPLRRSPNWESTLTRRATDLARREVEEQHIENITGGDWQTNPKFTELKADIERNPSKKRVIFIDSRYQRTSLMDMFKSMGYKQNQIKNIASTVSSGITGREMASRVKDFQTGKVPFIVIDKLSSTGFNLQNGDTLEILGAPNDASTLLQSQGRVARMPRSGNVDIRVYKYQDYLPEQAHWMELDNQVKLLRSTSPGMF